MVPTAHSGFSVIRGIGLVGEEVDFAEEAGLVVLEFADHCVLIFGDAMLGVRRALEVFDRVVG